jgi:hypothetical protein
MVTLLSFPLHLNVQSEARLLKAGVQKTIHEALSLPVSIELIYNLVGRRL